MVEFFSMEISAIVCRVRSCSATGCLLAGKSAEQEHHTALILPENAKRSGGVEETQQHNDGDEAHCALTGCFTGA